MPIILILGMPDYRVAIPDWEERLESLTTDVQRAVAALPVFEIPEDEVFVYYPQDLMRRGLGEELIAMVAGLFKRPERTPEVLKTLTDAIADQLQAFAARNLTGCGDAEAFIISMIEPGELSHRRLPTPRRLVGPPGRQ